MEQTIDNFFKKNSSRLQICFPDLNLELLSAEEKLISLQDEIWQITSHDPVMQKLGKEKFFSLTIEKKLSIIESTLVLLSLLKQAEQ